MRNILYLILCSVFMMSHTNVMTPNNNTTESQETSEVYVEEDDGFTGKREKLAGYITKKNGKEEEGFIMPGTVTDNEVKIIFISKSGKKQSFKPKDIQGYGYESSEEDDLGLDEAQWIHYETQKADYPPKPFASKLVFMEREEKGALSLYCYYIEVRDNPKKPFRYIYYMKDDAGKLTKIEKKTFAKVAKSAFKDYTAMANRVGRKDFIYKNLDRMVRDYNYWTENQHDRTEYRVAMVNKQR